MRDAIPWLPLFVLSPVTRGIAVTIVLLRIYVTAGIFAARGKFYALRAPSFSLYYALPPYRITWRAPITGLTSGCFRLRRPPR